MWIGAAALLGLLPVTASWAKFRAGTEMPVARLLQNVTAYVKAHPKDPQGYYTLGRINSAAFVQQTDKITVYMDDPLPSITTYGDPFPLKSRFLDKNAPLSPQTLTYGTEAIRNYKKAADLNASDGRTWLGLGFQCEQTLPFPDAVAQGWKALGMAGKPEPEGMRQKALRCYREAYRLIIDKDRTAAYIGPVKPLSLEAAESIVRLQEKHALSPADQKERDELQKQIAEFHSKPRAISPILISFQQHTSLSDLLSPQTHVRFDLAGDGLGRQWPWVKPTTGILVWDPKHTGKITSGLQLFGNVTWWLFWKDGYEPLAALDNNHNGWLEGAELQGTAVWFDRNGNGVADKGEVVSLASLGIKRIAAHSTGLADGVPANPAGVQLRDGSTLPTFDWTPTSLEPPIR